MLHTYMIRQRRQTMNISLFEKIKLLPQMANPIYQNLCQLGEDGQQQTHHFHCN